jgi:uncharacterized RDD family membrane protein YckC
VSDETRYIGLVTRTVALALDAALITLIALIVELGVALIVSVFHLPKDVKQVLVVVGAAAYVLWTVGYFVTFWSTTGETPGDRVMRIRVVSADGGRVKPGWAIVRLVGAVLSALPLFAGYLLILFDRRRRGLLDILARTVVVESPNLSVAAERRALLRAAAALRDGRSSDSGDERAAVVPHPSPEAGIPV